MSSIASTTSRASSAKDVFCAYFFITFQTVFCCPLLGLHASPCFAQQFLPIINFLILLHRQTIHITILFSTTIIMSLCLIPVLVLFPLLSNVVLFNSAAPSRWAFLHSYLFFSIVRPIISFFFCLNFLFLLFLPLFWGGWMVLKIGYVPSPPTVLYPMM